MRLLMSGENRKALKDGVTQPGAKNSLAPGQTAGIPALLVADKTAFGNARRYRGLHRQHFPFT